MPSSPPPRVPPDLAHRLASAKAVVVLTGAGISAESGVPTFRDSLTGLWARYNPEELATPEAFRRNPRLVWEWYEERRQRLSQVHPNPGHTALAELERRVPRFTLATQNVDGLHHRAGSLHVLELHGNITRTRCSADNRPITAWPASDERPPRCPHCRAFLRPDVVWFGEPLPESTLEHAREAASTCDLFLSVGTSSLVYPAAGLIDEALLAGAAVVEINPEPTPYSSRAAYSLRGPSGTWLPALMDAAFHNGNND